MILFFGSSFIFSDLFHACNAWLNSTSVTFRYAKTRTIVLSILRSVTTFGSCMGFILWQVKYTAIQRGLSQVHYNICRRFFNKKWRDL